MGESRDKGFGVVLVLGIVDVCWEELVDESAEHDVAGEVEDELVLHGGTSCQ